MFDTHVNLHGEQFADDLDETLERARAAGVRRMLAICDQLDNFESVCAIARQHKDVWCSVGVHPHYSKDYVGLESETLSKIFSSNPKVVAIGETGLDFHYGYSEEAAQVACLRAHIQAARETGLPIILHSREADELMGDILEEEYAKGPFLPLLHCYTSGERLLARGLDLGAYVSASGIVTFKNAHDVRRVLKKVPLDRIVVETDCPYLAPVPQRGRRNEPAYLPHVIEGVANLYEMPVDEIARLTEDNAVRLFSKVSV